MKIQIGARIQAFDKDTGDPVTPVTGTLRKINIDKLVVGAGWKTHVLQWTPKTGVEATVEFGVRRRAQDPPGTGQIGGRVVVIRLSDGVEVENETFTALVDATELDANGQWDKHEKLWNVTANVQVRLQVGVKLPDVEVVP